VGAAARGLGIAVAKPTTGGPTAVTVSWGSPRPQAGSSSATTW
jgi:hypothetical protein